MIKLHDYQQEKVAETLQILHAHKCVYLAGEVRTGKTLVSLHTAKEFFGERYSYKTQVLFITRKKAMQSIKQDFKDSGLKKYFDLLIVSMDSLHKVAGKPDLIILDEAHMFGTFPKPSGRAILYRKKFSSIPVIMLSGTPSPESYAQLFHQFWCTGYGPWKRFKNFYHWAHKYIDRDKIYIGLARPLNDWSQIKDEKKFLKDFYAYKVSITQKEDAGFKGEVVEKIIRIPAPEKIHQVLADLRKEKIAHGKMLIAHSSAQLYQYYHQLCSGTIIDLDGTKRIISKFKAQYIKKHYANMKIAIFYLYQAEGHMLRKMFPYHTEIGKEFNEASDDCVFICQVTSGSMGVNISTADFILFFNISHSATQYWQARARSQTREGGNKHVHWLFSDTGIEDDIYEIVQGKKNYTVQHFSKFLKKGKTKQLTIWK